MSIDRRAFVAGLTLGVAGAWAGGCSAGDSGPLIVGMELAYPPFEMTDAQGQPAGVSVDLSKAIAKALKRELKIENLPFDGLIPALKTGRIHLIVSSLTRTPERAESIDFTAPYAETGLCLLVAKSSPVQQVADLDQAGRKVAVKKGTTGHAWAAARLKQAEVLVLDKEAAAVLEVSQGKVDAFIYDQLSVFQHWKRNPETTRAVLQPFQKETWAVGVRKGDERLREQVEEAVVEFRYQQGFENLGNTWLKETKAEFRKLGITFIF